MDTEIDEPTIRPENPPGFRKGQLWLIEIGVRQDRQHGAEGAVFERKSLCVGPEKLLDEVTGILLREDKLVVRDIDASYPPTSLDQLRNSPSRAAAKIEAESGS